jgi:hypothetical protein
MFGKEQECRVTNGTEGACYRSRAHLIKVKKTYALNLGKNRRQGPRCLGPL